MNVSILLEQTMLETEVKHTSDLCLLAVLCFSLSAAWTISRNPWVPEGLNPSPVEIHKGPRKGVFPCWTILSSSTGADKFLRKKKARINR